jgi:UDP-2-acetamido-3-amino-2,3-dideoxy-glucuronate N-acetyltransferase
MSEDEEKYFAHETAVVDEPADIGPGSRIWHFSHVMPDAIIGSGCTIGQNVFIGAGVKIGDNVKIQNNVSVYEGVEIEDDVFCGPSCVFTNVKRPRSAFPREARNFEKTLIRKGATIGANATIVSGITVGEHAFIGAGSVVTESVAAHALLVGNPARQKGWACRCGEELEAGREETSFSCPSCREKYQQSGETLSSAEE